MKNRNNVFTSICYNRWNSPKNIYSNIRLFFRRFKWAYQRAVRGYADMDTWNMDSWLVNLFSDSLNHLADHHWGYPGTDEFPDDEKWTQYLKDMAQLFYQSDESNNYYPTPEWDKYWEYSEAHPAVKIEDTIAGHTMVRFEKPENPYSESSFEEEKENNKKRNEDFQKAWDMMGKVFYSLWD